MDDPADLHPAGQRLTAAYTELDAARNNARTAALQLQAAGMTEYRIAAALGVDRSTVRKWLGK
jgi:predicted transcriptional regulator